MGTRGAMGFRLSGKDHVFYNNRDSGPEGLGSSVVEYLHHRMAAVGYDRMVGELTQSVRSLIPIDENIAPSQTQKKRCFDLGIVNVEVSKRSTEDWYCLLHGTQGNPGKSLEAKYYNPQDEEFLKDSLYCEFAYIVNLDDQSLEIYKGFSELDGTRRPGRYWELVPESELLPVKDERPGPWGRTMDFGKKYGPVELVLALPLNEMESMLTVDIIRRMKSPVE